MPKPSPIGLGRQPQIGTNSSITFRKAMGNLFRVLQAGDDHHLLSLLPVGGRRHLMTVSQLQGVDQTQNFVEIATRAGWVGQRSPDNLFGVDDKHAADRGRCRSIGVDHVIQRSYLAIGISEDREVDGGVLGVVDVQKPAVVRLQRIHTDGDGLDVARSKLARQRGGFSQLGGANGREIRRVRKKHHPVIPCPLMKMDGALCGFLGEIGGGIAETQSGHDGSLAVTE